MFFSGFSFLSTTPFVYWYQLINDNAEATLTMRGIVNPDEWLRTCVSLAWKYYDFFRSGGSNPSPASFYVKLVNLAKLDDRRGVRTGCIKAGYEFTEAMKIIVQEITPIANPLRMSLKAIPAESGMPANLTARFKAEHILP